MTNSALDEARIPLTRANLNKIRVGAVRRGFWFRVLSRVERASIDLTIAVVERVRSRLLAEVLTSIVKKLLEAMESKVVRIMGKVGHDLAQKLSRIALGWGNRSAAKWPEDPGFVRYLTIMCLNKP